VRAVEFGFEPGHGLRRFLGFFAFGCGCAQLFADGLQAVDGALLPVDEGVHVFASLGQGLVLLLGGRKLLGELLQLTGLLALGGEELEVFGLDPVEECIVIGRFLPRCVQRAVQSLDLR
jgi:hypothetical protein